MIRSMAMTASDGDPSRSSKTQNSSPPRRATVSWPRTQDCSRSAVITRAVSPAV